MATRESSVREPRTGDAPVAEHTEPAQPAPAAPVAEQRVEAQQAEESALQLDVAHRELVLRVRHAARIERPAQRALTRVEEQARSGSH